MPSRARQALEIRLTRGVILAVNDIVLAAFKGPVVIHSTVESVLLEVTVVDFEITAALLSVASMLTVWLPFDQVDVLSVTSNP